MIPDRDKAKQDYLKGMKYADLAKKYGVTINTIKSWKQRYNWNRKGVHTNEKVCTQKTGAPKKGARKEKASKDTLPENPELTEKQRLFCLYYVKYWNAGKAAKKAGYEYSYPNGFYEIGCELRKKTQVKNEIDRLKQDIRDGVGMEAMAVLQKYIDIAFADITEFVEFGQKEVPVMNMFGPVIDKETGEPMMKMVNAVTFRESPDIDGTLISEVKQGKDGASVKLHDKMKALEKLEKYFDLLPDQHKRRIEEERLKLDQDRFEHEKGKAGDKGSVTDSMKAALEQIQQRRKERMPDGQ